MENCYVVSIFDILSFFYLFFIGKVYAGESYESRSLTTNIICNATEITATTTCVSGDLGGFPICQDQEFTFPRENGKSISVKAEGLLVKPESLEIKALDYLASAWACASGLGGKHLVVSYYNGGNCSECEFYMIYNLSGAKLTKNKTSFNVVAEKLKLTEGWSKNIKKIKIPFSNE